MGIENKIDHTMLKAEATSETIKRYCEEAVKYGFASVCTNSCWVPLTADLLAGSGVKACCVVGFPLGAMLPEAKAAETRLSVEAGAQEIDMVLNVGSLKEKNYDYVLEDILAVRQAAGEDTVLKVIIETCLLTDEEKRKACELSVEAGADYVKTSTGFSTGGATVDDVRLMKETVGARAKVKASGGIRTGQQARELIAAGADRIGTGNGVLLMEDPAWGC
ncbi:MAG: deoxyribose-phosphate aldolase [Lachnospiraceae bacterium]|nr:deoxyribose-phosphate aldolase [Lachnospiraceae bacterium]